jgi:hypothetical protein
MEVLSVKKPRIDLGHARRYRLAHGRCGHARITCSEFVSLVWGTT